MGLNLGRQETEVALLKDSPTFGLNVSLLVLIDATIILACVLFLCIRYASSYDAHNYESQIDVFETSQINDIPYTAPTISWEFDPAQDLQTPELPTGCEAVAASTLLRMNGVDVTKFDVADAMPKSSTREFVNAFWGDPYSSYGFTCMSPCIGSTLEQFVDSSQYQIVVSKGTSLTSLPYPCEIWVTMYMNEIRWTQYEEDGYKLPYNPHCIVVTNIDIENNLVYCVDPLVGETSYSLDTVESIYNSLGQQAVWINRL